MTILEARLTQMRQAATHLRASGSRIDTSVKTIHQLVDELLSLGVESPAALEFVSRYRNQKNVMDDWGSVILVFALRLDEAADEVELAVASQNRQNGDAEVSAVPASELVPIIPGLTSAAPVLESGTVAMEARYWRRRRKTAPADTGRRGTAAAVVADTPNEIPYDGYLSKQNRPLYKEFLQKKDELHTSQNHLDELIQQRETKMEELAALKNRLMSANHSREIDAIPRVQALKQQIGGIELEITETTAEMRGIHIDLARFSERLQRVTPAPGADLKLVATMEHAETLQVIKDHTQDCVNYIVNRMAVPPGLPTDAYTWNDNIARMPEYGISIGKVPLEGSVLVMERDHPYADDIYGHVMYVEKVENAQVWVTDNKHAAPVLLSELTTETGGITYLYFPWQTKG